ncbi:MAG: hypothetical protein EG823_07215 [Actinobacteria bacterium]|nr:hypothetical protein [Actinomycetota bacterium]
MDVSDSACAPRTEWRPSATNRRGLSAFAVLVTALPVLPLSMWLLLLSRNPGSPPWILLLSALLFGGPAAAAVALRLMLRSRVLASMDGDSLVLSSRTTEEVIPYDRISWLARSWDSRQVVLWESERRRDWCVDVDRDGVLLDVLRAHGVPCNAHCGGWGI